MCRVFFLSRFVLGSNVQGYLLGASGSVMAVVVAIAFLVPDYSLHLMFLGPVRLKYIALASFVITTVLDFNQNTGGKLAHLGGALFGCIYTLQYKKGSDLTKGLSFLLEKLKKAPTLTRRSPIKVAYKQSRKQADPSSLNKDEFQKRIDTILDKISQSGYDSLTKEEKETLFNASNKK